MSNKIANTSLFKLGLRFSVIFFIVVSGLKSIQMVISGSFEEYIKQPEFKTYAICLVAFSLVYGFLMASFQKRKHKK